MKMSTYDIETPDGWLLQVWRIRSPGIFNAELSAPVIVMHGLGGSALRFMKNARNESIAFILADNGYDVFLPNFRSNQFSNRKMSGGKPSEPTQSDYYRCGSVEISCQRLSIASSSYARLSEDLL